VKNCPSLLESSKPPIYFLAEVKFGVQYRLEVFSWNSHWGVPIMQCNPTWESKHPTEPRFRRLLIRQMGVNG